MVPAPLSASWRNSRTTWSHSSRSSICGECPDFSKTTSFALGISEAIVSLLEHYAAMAGFQIKTACRGTDYVFAQSLVRAGVGGTSGERKIAARDLNEFITTRRIGPRQISV